MDLHHEKSVRDVPPHGEGITAGEKFGSHQEACLERPLLAFVAQPELAVLELDHKAAVGAGQDRAYPVPRRWGDTSDRLLRFGRWIDVEHNTEQVMNASTGFLFNN